MEPRNTQLEKDLNRFLAKAKSTGGQRQAAAILNSVAKHLMPEERKEIIRAWDQNNNDQSALEAVIATIIEARGD